MNTKSGFVAIIGRPNVGKSTLLNCLLGKKISIVSAKPQTTRWQILGIKTDRVRSAQIIYIDTPGLQQLQKNAVNRYMNKVGRAVIEDADVIIFMIDARHPDDEDAFVLQKLKQSTKPIILVLNKIDLIKDKTQLLPLMSQLKEKLNFRHMIPISALTAENTQVLEDEIIKLLPEGPFLFPEDQITDKNVRFQAAEIIREKIINETEQELPFVTSVQIEEFTQEENLIRIGAIIWVEKRGQKIIIIGHQGARLKKIGVAARHDLEKLLGQKVFLRLWIKIKAHWTDDEKALKSLGYE